MLQQRTIIRLTGGLVLPLLLAACANNDNWWDKGGGSSGGYGGDSGYVSQTPMPSPTRDIRSSGGTYVVRPGVTLYQVSRETNIPLRSLIDANDLEPPYALQSGQRLVIPTARFHVVQKGDTVYSISRTYGVDMAVLTRTNHIPPPYRIKLGEKLQLPSRVNTQVADEAPTPRAVPMTRPGAGYTTSGATPVSTQPKGPLPPPPTPAGDFVWPAQGKIISTFGEKENGLHNDGVNIAVPSGTPVKAAQNGVVAYAGNELKGYGNLLLVRHANGWMTAYAHNSKLLVRRGDTVVKGQTISLAGSTGSVTTPQVHFEIRKGAKAVDPRSVIGG
jgi:murein DD-endopeptidase MepM/ murein hydrolase activator NlpD